MGNKTIRNSPARFGAILIVACITILTAPVSASKPAAIDAVVKSYYETRQFTGSVLVAEKGKVVYRRSYGLANRELNVLNSPEMKYRIASISKQFTAMLIMQLVEQGKINLDGNISDYLPYYRKNTGRRVTIHHLLTHTSGIPSLTDKPGFWNYETRMRFDLKTLVKDHCSDRLDFKPGTQYYYNNSGYVILGAIIEEITEKPYETVLQENILDPLAMVNTGYDHHEIVLPNRTAGYQYQYDGYQNALFFDMSSIHAAGALYSTVDDLLVWDQTWYTDKLISEASKEIMFTPFLNDYAYGLGIYDSMLPDSSREIKMISHTGGIHGFNSRFARYVDDRYTVIILGNQYPINHTQMNIAIRNILYNQPYELAKPSIAETLYKDYLANGIESASRLYWDLKATMPDEYNFAEPELNTLGYYIMRNRDDIDAVIEIFKLNVQAYPEAFNPYDSLGEAYLVKGEKKLSIANYEKSLELNPENYNGKIMLKKARRLPYRRR